MQVLSLKKIEVTNDNPIGNGNGILPYSHAIEFQIPQFIYAGAPTLAPGGGAVLSFNPSGSLASAWFNNNVFNTLSNASYVLSVLLTYLTHGCNIHSPSFTKPGETSQPIHTLGSSMLIEHQRLLISSDRRGADPRYQKAPESSIKAIPMADTPLSSDRQLWSLMSLQSQPDPTLTLLSPARRPIISLAARSYVASEPCFNLEGTLQHPLTPHPPTLPVQPQHQFDQFEHEYALPSFKLLPLEYNREVKSTKLQRKCEKGRENNEGRRDKDGTRDDWYLLGLNRWAASANPVWKRVSQASKCLST
jgi:hypothetical protein